MNPQPKVELANFPLSCTELPKPRVCMWMWMAQIPEHLTTSTTHSHFSMLPFSLCSPLLRRTNPCALIVCDEEKGKKNDKAENVRRGFVDALRCDFVLLARFVILDRLHSSAYILSASSQPRCHDKHRIKACVIPVRFSTFSLHPTLAWPCFRCNVCVRAHSAAWRATSPLHAYEHAAFVTAGEGNMMEKNANRKSRARSMSENSVPCGSLRESVDASVCEGL